MRGILIGIVSLALAAGACSKKPSKEAQELLAGKQAMTAIAAEIRLGLVPVKASLELRVAPSALLAAKLALDGKPAPADVAAFYIAWDLHELEVNEFGKTLPDRRAPPPLGMAREPKTVAELRKEIEEARTRIETSMKNELRAFELLEARRALVTDLTALVQKYGAATPPAFQRTISELDEQTETNRKIANEIRAALADRDGGVSP